MRRAWNIFAISLFIFSICFYVEADKYVGDIQGTITKKYVKTRVVGGDSKVYYYFTLKPTDTKMNSFDIDVPCDNFKQFKVGSKVVFHDMNLTKHLKKPKFIQTAEYNIIMFLVFALVGTLTLFGANSKE